MKKNDGDENAVTLKVAETDSRFVGRGIGMVDPRVMEELAFSPGDVVEIAGGKKKKSYVLLWSARPSDYGRGVIRIDGYTRNNLGIGIDDSVSVKKVEARMAEQVVVAPIEELSIVGIEEYLPELLEGRVVAKGDVRPPKGILLHDPPETGKTLLAKAVATTSESNFISVKGPELLSKWVGESEKGVREIFRKTRQAAPCVVFFDELDAIAPRRGGSEGDSHVTERVISQMLTEMDGREDLKGVVVVGATNRPDIIDEALLRPGRLDRILEIPKPDGEGRRQILQIHTKKKPLDRSVDQERLVELTDGMTGADIVGMVNAAAMSAIKERVSSGKEDDKSKLKITMEHFEDAIEKMKVQRKSAGRLHSLT